MAESLENKPNVRAREIVAAAVEGAEFVSGTSVADLPLEQWPNLAKRVFMLDLNRSLELGNLDINRPLLTSAVYDEHGRPWLRVPWHDMSDAVKWVALVIGLMHDQRSA